MKLFCQYSPSHEVLFEEYFKPSVEKFREFELIAAFNKEQVCPTGEYNSPGWLEAMAAKVLFWQCAITKNMGDLIVCCDVDMQFIKPCKFFLTWQMGVRQAQGGPFDILFQKSLGKDERQRPVCPGFFIARCTPQLRELFNVIENQCYEKSITDEQPAVNRFLKRRKHGLKWGVLPADEIWQPGYHDQPQQLKPPTQIMVHHANFCRGVGAKIIQLEHIKQVTNGNH